MVVPHLLKIYFGLGQPLSVLEIVSVRKIKNFFLSLRTTLESHQNTQNLSLYQNTITTFNQKSFLKYDLRVDTQFRCKSVPIDMGIK